MRFWVSFPRHVVATGVINFTEHLTIIKRERERGRAGGRVQVFGRGKLWTRLLFALFVKLRSAGICGRRTTCRGEVDRGFAVFVNWDRKTICHRAPRVHTRYRKRRISRTTRASAFNTPPSTPLARTRSTVRYFCPGSRASPRRSLPNPVATDTAVVPV